MTHTPTPISRHSQEYRGFTLVRLPKTVTQPITRYHLWLGDQSFGKVDTVAQATDYIDQLHQTKKIERNDNNELFNRTTDINHDYSRCDGLRCHAYCDGNPYIPKETRKINRLAAISHA
ncbi:hypothetical protein SK355_07270 [Candidatus Fukatsuia symbiotica]|uniref:hypothetical protein n=1 Tax=Candidatus Fukatsuia TaxID=1927833 RepID=UPI002B2411FE|nr:hypothetical protein [Candidatus Fukatsuia symbiotica]MEA9445065.1 hypothetical protein [Candidatus Fukatsuia symbiotica]